MGKSKAKKNTQKKPLVEHKKERAAIARVMVAAVLALALLYLSGISVLTLVIGAKDVDTRPEMTKGAMQSLTGEALGCYAQDEKGWWTAIQAEDGVITGVFEEKPAIGETVTATGFVGRLSDEHEADLFAWYDDNGDWANGDEHWDNVSPLFIRDGYGRYFDTFTSKLMITGGMLCAVYIILVYMGISSGRYRED